MPLPKHYSSSDFDWEHSGRRELCLALLKRGNIQTVFSVGKSGLIVGRDPSNDIALEDPRVSKRHAEISSYKEELIIQDLDSRNGTRVNGLIVKTRALSPGDVIRVGRNTLLYMGLGVPRERDSRRARGWLVVVMGHGKPMKLPVTEVPILVGRAEYADIRVPSAEIAEFHSQIVATSRQVQLMQLNTEVPQRFALKDGHQLAFGPVQAEYKIAVFAEPEAGPAVLVREEDLLVAPKRSSAPREIEHRLLDALQQEAERVESDIAVPGGKAASPSGKSAARSTITACVLTALTGPVSGKSFSIMYEPIVIGRAEGCGIRLEDDKVSGQHARLQRVSGDVVVECMDEKQEIFLNGTRIKRRPLRPGDRIRVGVTEFVVHI